MAISDKLQKQLISDLLVESYEGLDRFDQHLLLVEKGDTTSEVLNDIFRIIHTIKGTSGCLGLGKIEAVAHVGENLLSLLREGKIHATPAMVTTLLAYADALRTMLRSLEQTGDEGNEDYSTLLADLAVHQNPSIEVATVLEIADAPPITTTACWGMFEADESIPAPSEENELKRDPVAVHEAMPKGAAPTTKYEKENTHGPSLSDASIRVDVAQLDKLMNLVGELVLARNQIIQYTNTDKDNGLLHVSQRLNLITTELQENVMKTRMQPIGNVWAKFPRIVRDVASELHKEVHLMMEGKQTELDRTIIEAIKDPLTHIVRNSIDHGIELPEKRLAAGKSAEGKLILRAFHEGGQVNIEILDDGAGLNATRIKDKAVEKGLITPEQALRMGEREIYNLIFAPGFSTAEKITNVSGRGVGMDVVKTNIEKIGGSVDVFSVAGQGTTIKIKIPLTLAIIPALIVTSGQEQFAIPQVSLVELVRLEGEQVRTGIEMLYGVPVYRLRGQLMPLAYLHRVLKLREEAEITTTNLETVNIVVLQADGRLFGLVVDQINDTEEIVVKPLGKQLKGINTFAGATIMGDGRVSLILDVLGVAQQAQIINETRDRNVMEKVKVETPSGDVRTLLLFDVGKDTRMAIALSMVARLEEIPRKIIERSGSQEVVQYRGQILPLIRVENFIAPNHQRKETENENLAVVVYSENGRSFGLVVGQINDIVEQAVTVQHQSNDRGIIGSAVIKDRVTDFLDVEAIIHQHDALFSTQSNSSTQLN